MRAQLVQATIDPTRLAEAAASVRAELAPAFLAQSGARHAYWMAEPSTGRLLELKVWDTDRQLRAAAPADRAIRAEVAHHHGFCPESVVRMDVVGAREEEMSAEPDVRFARVTTVTDLTRDSHGRLPGLYREVVPDQARSHGFCASYWLADPATGRGMAISLWEGAAQISASQMDGARRRRRFEHLLGCRVESVDEFEALGVASEPVDRQAVVPRDPGHRRRAHRRGREGTRFTAAGVHHPTSGFADRGTPITRPPGALLAVAGDPAREVIVLLEGRATAVGDDGMVHLVEGAHFGASAVVHRAAHTRTVVATSPVDLLVFSRSEFVSMANDVPAVADYLLTGDLERA